MATFAILAAAGAATPAAAATVHVAANSIGIGQFPEETAGAIGEAISSNPGGFTGVSINNLLGANRFYAHGLTGQGTIAYNIEAGHFWNGHEALNSSTTLATGSGALGEFDRHATSVAMLIGGRNAGTSTAAYQTGLAPGTDLRSGAVASGWNGTAYSLSFNYNIAGMFGVYQRAFGTADVVNSSWGTGERTGTDFLSLGFDGMARANPRTTMVVPAGNAGPAANSVGSPGSGYNVISVGALTNRGNTYDTPASFSSRGPQDYADPVNGTVPGVRAAVDVSAPGDTLTSAYWGGPTGGNRPGLPGYKDDTSGANVYVFNIAGTSFSSPIVAGCVALLDGAARTRAPLSGNADARDGRVVKAVLLNSADKTPGWDNGQAKGTDGVVRTAQALDWTVGAGRVNMSRAYDQYLSGTADVPGTGGGTVAGTGWDFGQVGGAVTAVDYLLADPLAAGTPFTATLTWFRDRAFLNSSTLQDNAFRNLDLQVWDGTFTKLIAESSTTYNEVEHLSLTLPGNGRYGLRVVYAGEVFGAAGAESYGLAWTTIPVPEPTGAGVLGIAVVGGLARRRGRRPS